MCIGKTYNVILHLFTVWLFSRWSKLLWCLKHARILGDEVVCITVQNQPPSPCTAYGETTVIPPIMQISTHQRKFVLILELLSQLSQSRFFFHICVWLRTGMSVGNCPKLCILFCLSKKNRKIINELLGRLEISRNVDF